MPGMGIDGAALARLERQRQRVRALVRDGVAREDGSVVRDDRHARVGVLDVDGHLDVRRRRA